MIWIVASIPFWILAVWLAAFAIIGVAIVGQHVAEQKFDDATESTFWVWALLLADGAVLIIAAKLCS